MDPLVYRHASKMLTLTKGSSVRSPLVSIDTPKCPLLLFAKDLVRLSTKVV